MDAELAEIIIGILIGLPIGYWLRVMTESLERTFDGWRQGPGQPT